MNPRDDVESESHSRQIAAVILLLASFGAALACSREKPRRDSQVIPPAAPRPAAPGTVTVGREPIITTSGSPVPDGVDRAPLQPVTLRDGSITAPTLLPRGSTAFRVTNAGTRQHNLVIDGSTTHGQIEKPLAPGQTLILQMVLRDARYKLHCSVAGHHENTILRTYAPE